MKHVKPPIVPEWRPIVGWEGFYEVSSAGQIRRVPGIRYNKPGSSVLTTFVGTSGHRIVQLSRPDKVQTVRVARLVAAAFLPGFSPDSQVDHRNGDRTDDKVENLRPATHAQNAKNRGLNVNSSTKVKGVTFRRGKYEARIQFNGRRIHIGAFDDVETAAAAYREAATELFGEWVR